MATNKNQHFVPRCHLKPFTLDAADKAINLLNLDRRTAVASAPVKNQCSGSYFYGQDEKLEQAIQAVEGPYAAAVRRIHQPSYLLSDGDRIFLRVFMLFQNMRTEAASRRSVEMLDGLLGTATIPSEFRFTIKEAVRSAMLAFGEGMHVLDDLKVCLLRNHTRRSFITSDDPSVLTNRWHFEDPRVRHKSPGLASSGVILFLPLSPRVLCVAYDGDVYSVPHEGGWVEVRREQDVHACNEHQFLNAFANVYFRDWEDRDSLLSSFESVKHRRLPERHRVTYAVLDREVGDHKRYRVIEAAEVPVEQEVLVHSQHLFPNPNSWPSFLRWRSKGAVYTNGTGVGYIRADSALYRGSGDFRREPARR
jgi:hypothetical protein